MSEKKQDNEKAKTPSPDWMNAITSFWEPMTKAWFDSASAFLGGKTPFPGKIKGVNRFIKSTEFTANIWLAMLSSIGQSGIMDAFAKRQTTYPEVWMKMLKTGFEGLSDLQRQWIEKAGKVGESAKAYQFEHLDENIFKVWESIYEKELKQFFKVPQLGLGRFYQERFNQMIDAFNEFQTAMGEFLRLLYLPFEKTLHVMQENLQQNAEEGSLPESTQDYYQIWIKILEGHYMTLFKTPEYAATMASALSTFEEFVASRNRILTDLLKTLPIPSQKEMDELIREIYVLKKRVGVLENKMK